MLAWIYPRHKNILATYQKLPLSKAFIKVPLKVLKISVHADWNDSVFPTGMRKMREKFYRESLNRKKRIGYNITKCIKVCCSESQFDIKVDRNSSNKIIPRYETHQRKISWGIVINHFQLFFFFYYPGKTYFTISVSIFISLKVAACTFVKTKYTVCDNASWNKENLLWIK